MADIPRQNEISVIEFCLKSRKEIIILNFHTFKKILLGCLLACMGSVNAQDQPDDSEQNVEAFYIKEGELTPSEEQARALPYLTRQALTSEDQKTRTYSDLQHYFKEHKWVSIILNYHGYFSEEVQQYEADPNDQFLKDQLLVLLSSLPEGSYRNVYEPLVTPSFSLDISKEALEPLYKNKKVTEWYIDRELSQF